MKHYNVKITGKVQGVFYRDNTREEAEKLGIKGFVRNEDDGSVYMECEGEEQNLQKLLSWCKQGPPKAIVDKVIAEEGELKKYSDFKVAR
jgi:acylphosphatase